jgi:acyl-CoA thioester hydrolase
MRKLDLSDKALGEMGIMLPVIAIDSEYKKPVAYDETISVSTKLISVSACKLSFEHTVINEEGELVNHGHSSVAFVDSISRKPIRISENIKGKLLTLL